MFPSFGQQQCYLHRVISASPVSMHTISRTTSGHSLSSPASDPLSPFKHQPSAGGYPLSPFSQSPGWGPQQRQQIQTSQQIPSGNVPQPQTSQSPWAVDFYNFQHKGSIEGQQQHQQVQQHPGLGNVVAAPVNQWKQVSPVHLAILCLHLNVVVVCCLSSNLYDS